MKFEVFHMTVTLVRHNCWRCGEPCVCALPGHASLSQRMSVMDETVLCLHCQVITRLDSPFVDEKVWMEGTNGSLDTQTKG